RRHTRSKRDWSSDVCSSDLVPDEGSVTVRGLDTADPDETITIRRHTGMVFQNPDNQMVTSIVRDDIAFGPENLGLPREEIVEREIGRASWRERANGRGGAER